MGDEEATKSGYKSLEPFKKKGGFKAASFAFVYMTFESMGFVANMVSLVLYFYLTMHFDLSASANTLTNLMGSTFLLSIIGAFISDTYTNRFNTSLFFGILEILSLAIMTIQAHNPRLLPNPCSKSSCVSGGKAAILYGSLCLLALGSGGVKGALPPLGADQFDQRDPHEAKALASYFNYLLFSTTIGAAVGVTVIVWVSMNLGWWLGFLICTVVTAIGFLVLGLGKPFYRLQPPGESPILRIVQVIVVSFKNRKMSLPKNAEELYEINEKESLSQEEKISHTNQFR